MGCLGSGGLLGLEVPDFCESFSEPIILLTLMFKVSLDTRSSRNLRRIMKS